MLLESIPVIRRRGCYRRTLEALRRGSVTIGCIGGSITEARVRWNWPELLAARLHEVFPGIRIVLENVAIGATASNSGVFRADRDLIGRGCDLIFVEYAVNDQSIPTAVRRRTREGLTRKLLARTEADVAFVYTNMPEWAEDIAAGRVPASVAEFEEIAERYAVDSIWVGLHALRTVESGSAGLEFVFPDGLHPQTYGSSLYAGKILEWLSSLPEDGAPQRPLPAPLDPENWERAAFLDPLSLDPGEQWRFCRSHTLPWADMMLVTTCLGAKLQIPFTGTGLSLTLDFGQTSADFRYRVDGGEFIPARLDYPDWCGDSGWVRTMELGYPLERGDHVIELEVVRPPMMRAGSRFDIMLLGVIP